MGGDAGDELEAGGQKARVLSVVAVEPDDAGGHHLAAVGEGLALGAEAEVDAEEAALAEGGGEGEGGCVS